MGKSKGSKKWRKAMIADTRDMLDDFDDDEFEGVKEQFWAKHNARMNDVKKAAKRVEANVRAANELNKESAQILAEINRMLDQM